jgi:hypothetical protein
LPADVAAPPQGGRPTHGDRGLGVRRRSVYRKAAGNKRKSWAGRRGPGSGGDVARALSLSTAVARGVTGARGGGGGGCGRSRLSLSQREVEVRSAGHAFPSPCPLSIALLRAPAASSARPGVARVRGPGGGRPRIERIGEGQERSSLIRRALVPVDEPSSAG